MASRLELTIKPTILDRERRLVLDPDYIEYDQTNQVDEQPIRFQKKDIESLRYGVSTIRGYQFPIGRIYCIDIKNYTGQIIKLRLKSIYRIRIKTLAKKYNDIFQTLWNNYFLDTAREHLRAFKQGTAFDLAGVAIDHEGVWWDKRTSIIPWEIVGIKKYWRYFALFSELNPEQYMAFDYLHVWNAILLRIVIQNILRMKFPDRHPESDQPI